MDVLPPATQRDPVQIAITLITAERGAARAGDLGGLADMWTSDARIIDGRGTEDPDDDFVWSGQDAIMDRYILAVLPAPPPPLDDAALESLRVLSDSEGPQSDETRPPEVIHVELGIDRWTLTFVDGRWRLAELRYN